MLFASSTPEELARLAGSVQATEAVLQAEDGRFTGRASVTTRARHRVDPNAVRQLQPGQAVLISGGRAEKLQVIQAPGANNGLALPRRPFGPLQGSTRPSIGRVKSKLAPLGLRPLDPPNGPGADPPSPVPARSGPADDRNPEGRLEGATEEVTRSTHDPGWSERGLGAGGDNQPMSCSSHTREVNPRARAGS